MADVYGFNEAKSKIKVVDKATQDAKDSAQDTSIANKAVSSVGVALDDSNNLTVTVAQADGTSKSGSVALPAGGEIPTENYLNGSDIIDSKYLSASVTFSFTISGFTSASSKFSTLKLTDTVTEDALYLNNSNKLIRCKTATRASATSGSISTSRMISNDLSSGTQFNAIVNQFSFLIGLPINTTSTSGVLNYVIGTKGAFIIYVTVTDGVIASIWGIRPCSTSSSMQLNGTFTATLASSTSEPAIPNELLKTISGSSVPSTYKKVAGL